jgi:hypothetical protein
MQSPSSCEPQRSVASFHRTGFCLYCLDNVSALTTTARPE